MLYMLNVICRWRAEISKAFGENGIFWTAAYIDVKNYFIYIITGPRRGFQIFRVKILISHGGVLTFCRWLEDGLNMKYISGKFS